MPRKADYQKNKVARRDYDNKYKRAKKAIFLYNEFYNWIQELASKSGREELTRLKVSDIVYRAVTQVYGLPTNKEQK